MRLVNTAMLCVGIGLVASCAADTTDPAVEVAVESQALCGNPNIVPSYFMNPDDGPICQLRVTSSEDTFEYCTDSPGYVSKFELGVQFRASTVYVGMLNHNKISDGRLCRQGVIAATVGCSNDPNATATGWMFGVRVYNVEPEELYSQSSLVELTCPPSAPFPVIATAILQDRGVNNLQ